VSGTIETSTVELSATSRGVSSRTNPLSTSHAAFSGVRL
jgi:hypothetical protein